MFLLYVETIPVFSRLNFRLPPTAQIWKHEPTFVTLEGYCVRRVLLPIQRMSSDFQANFNVCLSVCACGALMLFRVNEAFARLALVYVRVHSHFRPRSAKSMSYLKYCAQKIRFSGRCANFQVTVSPSLVSHKPTTLHYHRPPPEKLQPQELIPQIANQIKVDWSLSTRKASGCVWFDQPPLLPGVVGRADRYPMRVDLELSSRYRLAWQKARISPNFIPPRFCPFPNPWSLQTCPPLLSLARPPLSKPLLLSFPPFPNHFSSLYVLS